MYGFLTVWKCVEFCSIVSVEIAKQETLKYPEDLRLLPVHVYKGPNKRRREKVAESMDYIEAHRVINRQVWIYLIFVGLLFLIVYGQRHPLAFSLNQSIKNTFVEQSHLGTLPFHQVSPALYAILAQPIHFC